MGNRRNVLIGTVTAIVILFASYFVYAKYKSKVVVDPAFKAYISAYTSGSISRESTIHIQLTADAVKPNEVNTTVSKKLFDFSPGISGTAVWIDTRTIEFRPSEKMKPGETYKATFFLGAVMTVPSKFSEFNFSFSVIKQSFEVNVDGLRTPDNKNFARQNLVGTLNTADVEDAEKIEKLLTAKQDKRDLHIRWSHQTDRVSHSFIVDSVIRGKDSSAVVLSWDGSPIGVDMKGEKSVMVPALGDFIFIDATVVQKESEQSVVLEFSDPISEEQNLKGLITLGNGDLRFTVENNIIRVYPSSHQEGSVDLFIDASVKNSMGKPLKESVTRSILFEDIKPAVRITGKGVILPSSNGLLFPFEAVNLTTVDVRVVQIFENNIPQFLQVNNLDGEKELVRVGRIVLDKAVPLSTIKQTDFTKWNQYALDLSDLIKVQPGAIYRVTLSFRKKYSLYKCDEVDTAKVKDADEAEVSQWDDPQNKEASSWDYIENYVQGDEEGGYNWSNRDNPCHHEYYNSQHWVSRNIIASDLGLLAKRGLDGSMLFTVTDIKSTDPMSGVTLEIYNYQQQLITRAETDGSGMAQIKIPAKPYLLIAKKGDQRGYLKLDDGSSLSLSMFDVSGDKVQKGLKGFIYGERGVWRPGDTIFLMFMLEDKQKTLPASYPVSMELYDPRGQLVKKIIRTENLNGFYSFITTTDPEAPTGSWEARVKVGNAVFSKNLRVEMVMPNRLKIKFDFAKPYLAKDEKQSAKMESHWLTGPAASGLKANVEVSLSASKTTFPKYSEFIFDDPTRKFSADKQVLFDHDLDANGQATVDADIKVADAAPGVLQANFVTKVFEPGGNFSVDRFSIPYHPYNVYTGIRLPKGDKARGMLLTDTDHIVQIVSVDKNGNPVPGKRTVEIQFSQIQWKWWWDKSEDNQASYENSSYNNVMQSDSVTIINGVGHWKLRVNYPSWGRYLLKVTDAQSGHCAGKVFYMDWPGWAGRGQKDQGGAATMLAFTADKEKYNVGEDAILTIPTSKGSRALISIESGTKVLKSYWLEGTGGPAQFKVPVTPDMAPNVYASVTLIQPHAQTVNDLPIRMYGIVPLMVENPNTHLKPVLKMLDVLRPLEPVNITVSESQGKAMTYTIAMVDEGLLDLTRFKTPDPWNSFYAREALGVKSWDMFDYVIGAWGAQLDRILSIGGDEGLNKAKGGSKANRFKPVVRFIGPFHLNKGETKTHSFIMPQYIGSVRTMIIAGEEGAYGYGEKTTPVRKPLMVLGTLPRVLGPGESVDLPVTVFALEKNIKDVNVQIVANDMFEPVATGSKSIKFKQTGDDVVSFKLKVKSAIGIGKVKIIATCGKERAETSIELDVRNPNPRITEVIDTIIPAGQTWNPKYKPIGIAGTNTAMLEVSSVPPLNLGKRLPYLIHYPYGCVEQTTSSVFPQLYLSNLMDLSPAKKGEIENNIKAGIARLRLFQQPSGAMSYWPGEVEENEWATNYAGHFLIEAELRGYNLPQGFIDQWKKYQHIKASTWSGYTDDAMLTQSYRLYTLALAKSPELGSMNRLRENKNLPVVAKWSLAAAYALVGQPEVANQLTANLPTVVNDYKELAGTYGSDERDRAIILETLSLMGKRERGMGILRELSTALCSKDFMSTQTTAYSLLAIAKFIGKAGVQSDMNFSYQINGAAAQAVSTHSAVKQTDLKVNGTVSVKNTGQGVLYARVIMEGIPKIGDVTSSESNIHMTVAYKDMDGNTLDPGSIAQGTDFYTEVSVTNPSTRGDYAEMALTQVFPSGWEILNSRLDNADKSTKTSVPRYQDIRDDRVYTYYNLKAGETKTFRLYLNASYYGNFYLPAVYTEAMYDASINARIAGRWIDVIDQDGRLSSGE